MSTLIIIPTYNERENVASIVGRVRASTPDVFVLVVDDSSPDGTGEIADALAAADDHVRVLHRAGKEGLGAAYREGMQWALAAGYDRIVEMDADGSHRPEELHRLLEAVETADVVLGSRWVPGGGVENWPASRRLLSRGGSAYSRLALGVPVKDATGGYRAFTARALERIRFTDVASQGYCFQIDMLRRAYDEGLRIVEVPITFVEREHGASKMTTGIVVEAMLRVTGWGIMGLPRRFRRRPEPTAPIEEPVEL
ncbi:polyprenol monophosphomannose synthase [Diaminobutyricibacter tongyongensis]|uniref:Polyprenol monophosphomannose synthase n=1 Tax=Leifsonia tongyongensis TaxID=1268043 RepID=A0A6L9XWC8_9MICO|nr:polyprenol monophosphomannose synthase [Diaminobutyricibacter tongyongensis]NEN05565.1 polyprenol monophosphomannose synthase [Diaminobutyricibacter tongyongensis]